MPTPFGHIWAAIALSPLYYKKTAIVKLLLLGMVCTIFPDIDVLAFDFGIPYGHLFGHRGFTHSIFFSFIFGLLITFLFYPKERKNGKMFFALFLFFFFCTLSHAVFDAMTNGGKGVAMFAPFYNERVFLPWRPIMVAPLSWDGLMTDRGMRVLLSEFKVIWIPSMLLTVLLVYINRLKTKN